MLAARQAHQHGAQQRPGVQIEAALSFLGQGLQVRGIRDFAAPQHALVRLGAEARGPTVGLPHETQAQGIVMADYRGQCLFQRFGRQRLHGLEQHRLVPVLALGNIAVEEHLMDRQQRHAALHRALFDGRNLFRQPRHGRQAAHTLVLEQVPRVEADAGQARTTDHLDRDNRIATELEEIIVQAHALQAQYVLPYCRQGLFHDRGRCNVILLWAGFRLRQGLAVELAVGGHRHLVQAHEPGRHHVFGQAVEQPGLEPGLPVAGGWRVIEHCPGNQVLAVRHQHHGLAHQRMLHQAGFNLSQFDTQPAQLDLMVETPEVLDDPIGTLAHPVSGAVQPRTVVERAWHETLGGQARATVVAAGKSYTAQVQLPRHAGRDRLQLRVQHEGTQIADGPADGHAVGALVHAGPVGHIDGRFGGAVQVVQARIRQLCEHLLLGIERQGFAAADNALEPATGLDAGFMDKGLEHRRHEVQGADGLVDDGLDQARGLAMHARRRHHQTGAGHQRPEELPHRHIETERGFLQHGVRRVQAVGLLHPAQAVDQGGVAVAGTLGLAGRAGGVDDIGQVQAVRQPLRAGLAVTIQPVGVLIQQQGRDTLCWQRSQQRALGQ
ncbi:hypothetical protein D3C76_522900 [compost metagenome]